MVSLLFSVYRAIAAAQLASVQNRKLKAPQKSNRACDDSNMEDGGHQISMHSRALEVSLSAFMRNWNGLKNTLNLRFVQLNISVYL